MKFYITKSNARRAAKQAGITEFEVIEKDGKFAYKERPVIGEYVECPHCEVHLSNGYTTHEDEVRDGKKGLEGQEFVCLACGEEFGPALKKETKVTPQNKTKKQAEPIKGIPLTNKSVVDKPVKLVWHIADEMFAAAEANGDDQPRRKDVLAECVKRGIAFYTARTQYQQWWLCRNGKY